MSCEYCELHVGQQYEIGEASLCCMECGNTIYTGNIQVVYKYKNKGEHRFNLIKHVDCQLCDTRLTYLCIPCGGSYYFNESDVSESLLLPQEFIKNK